MQGVVEEGALPVFLSVVELNEVCYAATESSGLFRSTDYGAHWIVTGAGLPREPMTLAVGKGCLFAAGRSGVWLSTHEGNTWSSWNTGLATPLTPIGKAPVLLVEDDCLLAGGLGIWKRGLGEALPAFDEPAANGLTLAPNPTTGVLRVTGWPAGSQYEVYDNQGRFVTQGEVVDCRITLPPLVAGCYFLRLPGKWFPIVFTPTGK